MIMEAQREKKKEHVEHIKVICVVYHMNSVHNKQVFVATLICNSLLSFLSTLSFEWITLRLPRSFLKVQIT